MERIIPQKDAIYALNLSELGAVMPAMTEEGEQHLIYEQFSDDLINGKTTKDIDTIVTYKGNGLFEEHFSGEKAILIVDFYDSEPKPASGLFKDFSSDNLFHYKNENDKKAKVNFFKKVPLVVDPEYLKPVTQEIIEEINNGQLGDVVRSYISKIKAYAIHEIGEAYDYLDNDKPIIKYI